MTKFSQVPNGYWDNLANQKQFLDKLSKDLNITDPRDYFKVTWSMIKKHRGVRLLIGKYKSIGDLFATLLPDYRIACREVVMKISQDLKIARVEEIVDHGKYLEKKMQSDEIDICVKKNQC